MIDRVVRTWAEESAAVATVLRDLDPSWRSESFPVAGGHAVLWGAGLYVNRAMAVGIDVPITDADFDSIETRSRAVGVPASLEISPNTLPETRIAAEARGYRPSGTVSVLRCRLDVSRPAIEASFTIEYAAEQVEIWQEVTALGWGHTAELARRASDAYAAAVATRDGDGFIVAKDPVDGRPVGCASVSLRNGIATLSSMTTIPAERRRGVQAALIHHRLRAARAAGCDLATTMTCPGGDSERNLRRHDFEPWFSIETLTRTDRQPTR